MKTRPCRIQRFSSAVKNGNLQLNFIDNFHSVAENIDFSTR